MLEHLADGVVVRDAGGDPNVGAIIGAEGVVAIDALATPSAARPWLEELRTITDKPIRFLVLTHYHAVRVLGASAFDAGEVVSSTATAELIRDRGAEDWETEFRRFPRLAPDPETVPGLTIPTIAFEGRLVLDLGDRQVHVEHAGRGHTGGDSVVWLPEDGVLFAGDLVEAQAATYMGEAHIDEWRTTTLDRVAAFGAQVLVPGRGPAARGKDVERSVRETRGFLDAVWDEVAATGARGAGLQESVNLVREALAPRYGDWTIFEHCLPFNVKRARDEQAGLPPQIWTAEADEQLWREIRG